jgi:hypothetical protein
MRHSLIARVLFAFAVIVLLLISERPVHAYIDPGSGSLIYQTALAMLLGAGFYFRKTLASIARLFRGRGADTAGELEARGRERR